MIIPDDVLAVLEDERLVLDGDRLSIPWELGRPLYEKVKRVLGAAGGRWDGRKGVRAFVWPHDVEDMLRQAITAGEFVSDRDLGWFPTPAEVAREVMWRADIRAGQTVLEPSAGTGALVSAAAEAGGVVDAVELVDRRAAAVEATGDARRVVRGDFLKVMRPLEVAEPYDRVVMNPPFHQAAEHVEHALGFLSDRGILVAVMPGGLSWHTSGGLARLRQLAEDSGGDVEELPPDSFRCVGTRVMTCLLTIYSHGDGLVRNWSWHQRQPRQLDLFDLAAA